MFVFSHYPTDLQVENMPRYTLFHQQRQFRKLLVSTVNVNDAGFKLSNKIAFANAFKFSGRL